MRFILGAVLGGFRLSPALSVILYCAASDVFSHSLQLSLRDKIVFTVCAPLLVPFRITIAVLLAFLIWSSSRLGLLFTNQEVSEE